MNSNELRDFFFELGDQLHKHWDGMEESSLAAQLVLAACVIATAAGAALNTEVDEDGDS